MKCWKCGSECEPSVKSCPTCGALLERSEPAGEIGKAMRMLFDRYGAEKVLTNSAYLVNGLGDLTEDSGKVRNRIKMAMDAGAGKAYLEQIAVGKPDASFDRRVRTLLTDEAGLSDKAAGEIAGYFDEMIGWRAEANAQSSGQAAEAKIEPEHERRKPQNDFGPEIDRKKPKEDFGPEIDRGRGTKTAEPAVSAESKGIKDLYLYEKLILIFLGLACLLTPMFFASVATDNNAIRFYPDYFTAAILGVPFLMSYGVGKNRRRVYQNKYAWILTMVISAYLIFSVSSMIKYTYYFEHSFPSGEVFDTIRRRMIQAVLRFFSVALLWIRMIHHRIAEGVKAKKGGEQLYAGTTTKPEKVFAVLALFAAALIALIPVMKAQQEKAAQPEIKDLKARFEANLDYRGPLKEDDLIIYREYLDRYESMAFSDLRVMKDEVCTSRGIDVSERSVYGRGITKSTTISEVKELFGEPEEEGTLTEDSDLYKDDFSEFYSEFLGCQYLVYESSKPDKTYHVTHRVEMLFDKTNQVALMLVYYQRLSALGFFSHLVSG